MLRRIEQRGAQAGQFRFAPDGIGVRPGEIAAPGTVQRAQSQPLRDVLGEVLTRDEFHARLEQRGQNATAILAPIREVAHVSEPAAMAVPTSLRDPDDAHVLACAVAAAADAIVTGDHDLLAMGSFEGIQIIDVTEALRRLGLETE